MHVKNKEIQKTGNKQHERSVSFTCIGNTLTFWYCCIAGAIAAAAVALYLRSYRAVCCCFCFLTSSILGILGKWIIFLKIAYKLIHRSFASPFFYFSYRQDAIEPILVITCFNFYSKVSHFIRHIRNIWIYLICLFYQFFGKNEFVCLFPFCTFQVSEKNNQLIH